MCPAVGIVMPTPLAICGSSPMVTNSVVPMANPPIASARIARLTCRHDTGASTSTRSVSATMEAAVTAESLPNAPSRAGIAEILQTGCRPTPCETAPTFQRTAGVNDHTTSERIHFEGLCPADLASRRHRHRHARTFLDSLATRRGWLCPTQREGPFSAGPFFGPLLRLFGGRDRRQQIRRQSDRPKDLGDGDPMCEVVNDGDRITGPDLPGADNTQVGARHRRSRERPPPAAFGEPATECATRHWRDRQRLPAF